MAIEVEAKYRVDSHDLILSQLADARLAGSCTFPANQIEVDVYYKHPSRDLVASDEWLRLRTVTTHRALNNTSEIVYLVTYKGPALDSKVKSRQEIEIRTGASLDILFNVLGFKPFVSVIKNRQYYSCYIEDFTDNSDLRHVAICLDTVEHLGKFVEFEIVCEEQSKEKAKEKILRIARKLGLQDKDLETRGYAKLMMLK